MSHNYTRCYACIDTLTGLIAEHQDRGEDVPEALVLLAIKDAGLTFSDFVALDERPGTFGSYRNDWHREVRKVRNNPTNNLFEILKEG